MILIIFLLTTYLLATPTFAVDYCQRFVDPTSCNSNTNPKCSWIPACGTMNGLCLNADHTNWEQEGICGRINPNIITEKLRWSSTQDYTKLNLNLQRQGYWPYWETDATSKNILKIRAMPPHNNTHQRIDTSHYGLVDLQKGIVLSMEAESLSPHPNFWGVQLRCGPTQKDIFATNINPNTQTLRFGKFDWSSGYKYTTNRTAQEINLHGFNKLAIDIKDQSVKIIVNDKLVQQETIAQISDQTCIVYFYVAGGNTDSQDNIDFNLRDLRIEPYNSSPACPRSSLGDSNCDGKVSLLDFAIWKINYIKDKLLSN